MDGIDLKGHIKAKRQSELDELKELEELEELEQLESEARASQYETPAWQGADDMAGKAAGALREAGKTALGWAAAAHEFIDPYTGAPVRAALSESMKFGPERDVRGAVGRAVRGEGAPTGKDIAEQMGLSGEPSIKSPLVLNPFDPKENYLSPAGIAGAALETVTDPTAYVPLPGTGVAKQALTKAGRALPMLEKPVRDFARERAVKAATGQSKRAIQKLARVHRDDPRIQKQINELNRAGEYLLEKPEQGQRIVRPFSGVEGVGKAAAQRLNKLKDVYKEVSSTVDTAFPAGSSSYSGIADDLQQYANSLRLSGKSGNAKALVEREVEKLREMGAQMGDDMRFDDLVQLKADYPYDPQSPDLLISNKDAVNQINRIIDDHMTTAVKRVETDSPAEIAQLAKSNKLLENYQDAKNRYGVYRRLSEAAADRARGDVANRIASPSDQMWGGALGGARAVGQGGWDPISLLMSAGGTAFHKFLRSRGSSAVAVAADRLADLLKSRPDLGKYAAPLLEVGKRSPAMMVYNHALLMQEDPNYRKAVEEGLTDVKTEPYASIGNAIDAVGMGQIAFAGVAIPIGIAKLMKRGNLLSAASDLLKNNPSEKIDDIKNVFKNEAKKAGVDMSEESLDRVFDKASGYKPSRDNQLSTKDRLSSFMEEMQGDLGKFQKEPSVEQMNKALDEKMTPTQKSKSRRTKSDELFEMDRQKGGLETSSKISKISSVSPSEFIPADKYEAVHSYFPGKKKSYQWEGTKSHVVLPHAEGAPRIIFVHPDDFDTFGSSTGIHRSMGSSLEDAIEEAYNKGFHTIYFHGD